MAVKTVNNTKTAAKPAKKTKEEIEEEEEDEEDEVDDEDVDEEEEDDEEFELDLDLDVEFGSATDFDPIPAGTYPAVVVSETKNGPSPDIRKIQFGDNAGEKGVNFGFKIVGERHPGRYLWKEVPLKYTDTSGRNVLSMTIMALLGKRSEATSLASALEECQDQPCYIRVTKKQSKTNKQWYNNVVFVIPADEKHPSNREDAEDEDDD